MNPEQLRQIDNDSVWHPFTAMSSYRDEHAPIIADADGFYLIDTTGRRYLDGHSSLWCNIHGHRVPAIDTAIREQLDRVAHSTLLGLSNVPSIELANELVRRAPAGLTKVFYADCGAAGVEVALKMAYQYYQQRERSPEPRDKFIYFDGAYHGDTIGTMSIGSISRFKNMFAPLLFPAIWTSTPAATPGHPFPTREQPAYSEPNSIANPADPRPGHPDREREQLEHWTQKLARLLDEHRGQIAGVVIEPLVQAAAGIKVQAAGFLQRVRELTRQRDVLLIADEIAVGFGRTGKLFACEHEDVSPDILILSKGLTGGYLPLAATLVTDEIYKAFLGEPWEGKTFYHGHTYTGNPLACAAALASIRLIDTDDVLSNAGRLESTIHEGLKPLHRHAGVREIRQRGVMVGIELANGDQPYSPELRVGHQVTLACRDRGVVLRNIGDVVVLMPAPAMPIELVKHLCEVVCESGMDVLGRQIEGTSGAGASPAQGGRSFE